MVTPFNSEVNMKTIQDIKSAIYNLLDELENHDSMEHRMVLENLSVSALSRWKQLQDAANECDNAPEEERVTGHKFIAKVQCVNTGYQELGGYSFNTLAEAKSWCKENQPEHHYRNFVCEDIIEIDLEGNPVQWHYRTPDTSYRYDDGDGYCLMW